MADRTIQPRGALICSSPDSAMAVTVIRSSPHRGSVRNAGPRPWVSYTTSSAPSDVHRRSRAGSPSRNGSCAKYAASAHHASRPRGPGSEVEVLVAGARVVVGLLDPGLLGHHRPHGSVGGQHAFPSDAVLDAFERGHVIPGHPHYRPAGRLLVVEGHQGRPRRCDPGTVEAVSLLGAPRPLRGLLLQVDGRHAVGAARAERGVDEHPVAQRPGPAGGGGDVGRAVDREVPTRSAQVEDLRNGRTRLLGVLEDHGGPVAGDQAVGDALPAVRNVDGLPARTPKGCPAPDLVDNQGPGAAPGHRGGRRIRDRRPLEEVGGGLDGGGGVGAAAGGPAAPLALLGLLGLRGGRRLPRR